MYRLHQSVESILTPGGASWSSTCMDVPVVLTAEVEDAFAGDDFFSTEDEDDEWKEVEEEDPSVLWYGEAYCQVVESMPRACLERSILELWGKVSGSCLPGFCSQNWLHAHLEKVTIGANAVSWAPASLEYDGAVESKPTAQQLVSAGCDNQIKIWTRNATGWEESHVLQGHSDWVRDVAWAPSVWMGKSYIASCGQDKNVFVWVKESVGKEWQKVDLRPEGFADVVWRARYFFASQNYLTRPEPCITAGRRVGIFLLSRVAITRLACGRKPSAAQCGIK